MEAGRKFEAVQQLQSRLALAISTLQLALSAVTASGLCGVAGYGPGYSASPFAYLPDAIDVAYTSLQQMEMGRTRSILLAGGELWQRGLVGKASGKVTYLIV